MHGYLNTLFTYGILSCLLWGGVANADIYRCAGDGGGMVFQDRPCSGAVVAVPDAAPIASAASASKSFLWQAQVGKGRLYLLGSIHFGVPEMYPLPAVITSAFDASDTLVVEANILDVNPAALAQLVASKAVYHDGSTLRQQLSDNTWRRLSEVASGLGMPVEMLNVQKPWFVSMTLTALALNRLGFSESLGIDRHFLDRAQGSKTIVELEGMEWQLSLFDRLTAREQVLMLEETLREIDNGKRFFDRMLNAWKRGDSAAIQALFDEGLLNDPAAERLNTLLITDRNHSMTERLEMLAAGGGTFFVVVGAGHFTGNEGIIALLRQKGYSVSQR